MYNIDLKKGGHKWEKQNLITIFNNRKHYDILKCSQCGLQGKTINISTISLKGSYKKESVYSCTGRPRENNLPQKIRIIKCVAIGECFSNLIPGSEHEVVEPPLPYKNDERGLWVMGVGEPVKVLTSEFKIIN